MHSGPNSWQWLWKAAAILDLSAKDQEAAAASNVYDTDCAADKKQWWWWGRRWLGGVDLWTICL